MLLKVFSLFKMLPVEVEEIIHSYVDHINYWESLPSVKTVSRLIEKSNQSLTDTLIANRFIPPHVVRHSRSWSFAFALTTYNHEVIERSLSECLNYCCSTSAVFWLFVSSTPGIYHGPYARLFENKSFLFQLINISAMDPAETSESVFLCLQRSYHEPGYEVSHL